jgi:hypothetical protein
MFREFFKYPYRFTIIHSVISGFKITGSSSVASWMTAGIYCANGTLTVKNNVITGNKHGIAINKAKPYIINNTILNNTSNGIIIGPSAAISSSDFKAAFIYATNLTAAQNYKTCLDEKGIQTTLLTMSQIATTSFTSYRIIIIAHDTGSGNNWGTLTDVNKLKSSGRPVIGLGYGGAAYFQAAGLSINWGNSMTTTTNNLYVPDSDGRIYKSPNNITVPAGNVIQLYNTAVTALVAYAPALGSGVSLLGRSSIYPSHYPIVKEEAHFLWGYSADASQLTATGKDVFENVARYAGSKAYPYLAKPEIFIKGSETISGGTMKRFT